MKKSDKPRGMTATGKTREAVIVFLDALIERRFSDAEKALDEIRSRKNSSPEFQTGYLSALEGMLVSARSGDERDFLNRAQYYGSDMERYNQDFKNMLNKGLPKPFDLGFFSAWSDYIHYRFATGKVIIEQSS